MGGDRLSGLLCVTCSIQSGNLGGDRPSGV